MLPIFKIPLISIVIIIFSISVVRFSYKTVEGEESEDKMPEKTIEEVLKEHTNKLMSIPGVVGTAQGLCDNKPCIKVYVVKRSLELEQKIPKKIEGFVVGVEETGEFHALPENQDWFYNIINL